MKKQNLKAKVNESVEEFEFTLSKKNILVRKSTAAKISEQRVSNDEYDELVNEVLASKNEGNPNKMEINTKEDFVENYELMMKRGKAFLCSLYVLEDREINETCKVLFFIISSHCFNKGYCYATTKHLANKLNASESTVKRCLEILQTKGLIAHDNRATKKGFRRNIHIQFNNMRMRYMKGDYM